MRWNGFSRRCVALVALLTVCILARTQASHVAKTSLTHNKQEEGLHLWKIEPNVVWLKDHNVTVVIYGSTMSTDDTVFFTPHMNCSNPQDFAVLPVQANPSQPGTSKVYVLLSQLSTTPQPLHVCYRFCDKVADNLACPRQYTWLGTNPSRRLDVRDVTGIPAKEVRAQRQHWVKLLGTRPGLDRAAWVFQDQPCPLRTAAITNDTIVYISPNQTVPTLASAQEGDVMVPCILFQFEVKAERYLRLPYTVTARALTYNSISYMYPSHLFTGIQAQDTEVYIEGTGLRTGDMITVRAGPCDLPWGAGVTPPQPNAVPITAADDGNSAWFTLTAAAHLSNTDFQTDLERVIVCYGDSTSDTRSGLYAQQTRINVAEWTVSDFKKNPFSEPKFPGLQLAGQTYPGPDWATPTDVVGGISSTVATATALSNFLNPVAREQKIKISPAVVWDGIETEFTVGGPQGINEYGLRKEDGIAFSASAACVALPFPDTQPPVGGRQIGRFKSTLSYATSPHYRVCGRCVASGLPNGVASCTGPDDTVTVIGDSDSGVPQFIPAVTVVRNPPHQLGAVKILVTGYPNYVYLLDNQPTPQPVAHKWVTLTQTGKCEESIAGIHSDADGLLELKLTIPGTYSLCVKPGTRFGLGIWDDTPDIIGGTSWNEVLDNSRNYKLNPHSCVYDVPGDIQNEVLTTGNGTECDDMQVRFYKTAGGAISTLRAHHGPLHPSRAFSGFQVHRFPSHGKCLLFGEGTVRIKFTASCFGAPIGPPNDVFTFINPTRSRYAVDGFEHGRNSKIYPFPNIKLDVIDIRPPWPKWTVGADIADFKTYGTRISIRGLGTKGKWYAYMVPEAQKCRGHDPSNYGHLNFPEGQDTSDVQVSVNGDIIPKIGITLRYCLRLTSTPLDLLAITDVDLGVLEGKAGKSLDEIWLYDESTHRANKDLYIVVAGVQYSFWVDGAMAANDRISVVPTGPNCDDADGTNTFSVDNYGVIKVTVPRASMISSIANSHQFCYRPTIEPNAVVQTPLSHASGLFVLKPERVVQKYVVYTHHKPQVLKPIVIDGKNMGDDSIAFVPVGTACPIGTNVTLRYNDTMNHYGMLTSPGTGEAQFHGGSLSATITYFDPDLQWPNGPPQASMEYKVCWYPRNLMYQNLNVWDPEKEGFLNDFKLKVIVLGALDATRVPSAAGARPESNVTNDTTMVTISGLGLDPEDSISYVPILDGDCRGARFDALRAEKNYTASVKSPYFKFFDEVGSVWALCYKPVIETRIARDEDWVYLDTDPWIVTVHPLNFPAGNIHFGGAIAGEDIDMSFGVRMAKLTQGSNDTTPLPGRDNATTLNHDDEFKVIENVLNCTKSLLEAPIQGEISVDYTTFTGTLSGIASGGIYQICYKSGMWSDYPLLPLMSVSVPEVTAITPAAAIAHATSYTFTLTGAGLQTGTLMQLTQGNCTKAEFAWPTPVTLTGNPAMTEATGTSSEPIPRSGLWSICLRSINSNAYSRSNVLLAVESFTLWPPTILQSSSTTDNRVIYLKGNLLSPADEYFLTDQADCSTAVNAPLKVTTDGTLVTALPTLGTMRTCFCHPIASVVDCTDNTMWSEVDHPDSTVTVVGTHNIKQNLNFIAAGQATQIYLSGHTQPGDEVLLAAPGVGCTPTTTPLDPLATEALTSGDKSDSTVTLTVPFGAGFGTNLISVCYKPALGPATEADWKATQPVSDIQVLEAYSITPTSVLPGIMEDIVISGTGLHKEDWIAWVRDYYTDCSDAYMNAQAVREAWPGGNVVATQFVVTNPGLYKLCYWHHRANSGFTLYPHISLRVQTFVSIAPKYISMENFFTQSFTLQAAPGLTGEAIPSANDQVALVAGEGCDSITSSDFISNVTFIGGGLYTTAGMVFNYTFDGVSIYRKDVLSVCLNFAGSQNSDNSGPYAFAPIHDSGLRVIVGNETHVYELNPKRVIRGESYLWQVEGTKLGTETTDDKFYLSPGTSGTCSTDIKSYTIPLDSREPTNTIVSTEWAPSSTGEFFPCFYKARTHLVDLKPATDYLVTGTGPKFAPVTVTDLTEITPHSVMPITPEIPTPVTFTFKGYFNSQHDYAALVPKTASPSCSGLTPSSPGVKQIEEVSLTQGRAQFNTTAIPGIYVVCYLFKGQGSFKLYDTAKFEVTVRNITSIEPFSVLTKGTGIGGTPITVRGVGIKPGDGAGWIPMAPKTAYCNPADFVDSVNTTSNIFIPNLPSPNPPTTYRLCWRFGKFVAGQPETWDATDVFIEVEPPMIRGVRLPPPDTGTNTITNPYRPNELELIGTGLHHWDSMRWVIDGPQLSTATSSNASVSLAGPCLNPNLNGTNSYLNWRDVHRHTMEFYAQDLIPGETYRLCYNFAFSTGVGQPQYFPNVTLIVARSALVLGMAPRFPTSFGAQTFTLHGHNFQAGDKAALVPVGAPCSNGAASLDINVIDSKLGTLSQDLGGSDKTHVLCFKPKDRPAAIVPNKLAIPPQACNAITQCSGNTPYLCTKTCTCVASQKQCLGAVTCPTGYTWCSVSSMCADRPDSCPPFQETCPTGSYRCPQGQCVGTFMECPTVDICPHGSHIRCPDGSCHRKQEHCLLRNADIFQACPFGSKLCEVGVCVKQDEECPNYQGCPITRPYQCSDCLCHTSETECMQGNLYNTTANEYRCILQGTQVSDPSECLCVLGVHPVATTIHIPDIPVRLRDRRARRFVIRDSAATEVTILRERTGQQIASLSFRAGVISNFGQSCALYISDYPENLARQREADRIGDASFLSPAIDLQLLNANGQRCNLTKSAELRWNTSVLLPPKFPIVLAEYRCDNMKYREEFFFNRPLPIGDGWTCEMNVIEPVAIFRGALTSDPTPNPTRLPDIDAVGNTTSTPTPTQVVDTDGAGRLSSPWSWTIVMVLVGAHIAMFMVML
eukprot:TRINITY_DN6840_c0_g1_i1.p1 TRINITY_DN6840_c0_g1~~TRINITY_DN6840_c0_g1_i1.p1  ORF type:complete len:2904 (+),score=488.15 TRINITY_DN6840_c0_g1_i1:324-9035(+)